jgi:hypothetical protein
LLVRNLAEAVLPRLSLIKGVLDYRIKGVQNGSSSLEIKITDRSMVLPKVLQFMIDNGAEICDCQLQELPLEDILVHVLQDAADGRGN